MPRDHLHDGGDHVVRVVQAAEDRFGHFRAHRVVAVEADAVAEGLARWLGDVVRTGIGFSFNINSCGFSQTMYFIFVYFICCKLQLLVYLNPNPPYLVRPHLLL